MPRKRNIMREFRIDEISGVDVPAQEGAAVTIMKRAEPEQVKKYRNSYALTTLSEGHQHGIEMWKASCDCGCVELSVDYSSDMDGNSHTHPMTLDPLAIGASVNHTHDIEGGIVVKVHKDGGSAMADDTTTTDEPTIEGLQTENQRLAAIVGLSTEERAHFDALPEGMRDTFLGKSADERRAEIVAKNDADPVVYTTSDGVEIRKSAGEAVLAIAKSNDELRKANASLIADREQATLEKRAETELSHLPGDVATRAALLKAVDGMPEAHREGALAALKSKNDLGKAAFQTMGHTGGSFEAGSAEDELDKMAKNIASTESIDYHTAYAKALTSTEGQALYKRSVDAIRG